ncbi:MAG: UbiA family prenyltransferase [Thermoplasmatota archaeon]
MTHARAWLRAIDPPIYILGIFPPLIGAAATLSTPHPIPLVYWAWPLLGFLLLHGATNVANDAFDAATPADRVKHHSLARLAKLHHLYAAAMLLVAAAAVCGLIVWLRQPSWTVPLLSILGIFLLLAYHAPPLRLSHLGWGEAVTVLAFGPIPVWATSALGNGTIPATAIVPGLLAGLAATLVLVHHNVASRINDAAGGKRTAAVRVGATGARLLESLLETMLCVAIATWVGFSGLGLAVFLVLAVLAVLSNLAVHARWAWTRAASLGLYTAACGTLIIRLLA